MKNIPLLALIIILVVIIGPVYGQKNIYTTTGGEWIFSEASATLVGSEANSILRFSPVFNFQSQVHRDFNDHMGLMTGIALRNVGFIVDDPNNANTRYKVRSYNIGIPIGLKFGKMDGRYFFGGYELEIPINYKQKTFVDEKKTDKFDVWFSSRQPSIYNTVFVGIGLPEGMQIKFKYYLDNWFNQSYKDSNGNAIYAITKVNVFYVSLTFQILKGTSFYYKHKE